MEGNDTSLEMQELYAPVDSYKNHYQQLHHDNIVNHFNNLIKESAIDIEANRATNNKIDHNNITTAGNNKAIKRQKMLKIFGAVILAVSIIAIINSAYQMYSSHYIYGNLVVVIVIAIALIVLSLWIHKKTKARLDELRHIEGDLLKISQKLHAEASEQMKALNVLLYKNYNTELFTKTLPLVKFDEMFDSKRLSQMIDKFGLNTAEHEQNLEQSTLFVQSGEIKGNPFFIRSTLRHQMGTKKYEGSLTIHWTTREKDSNGNYKTVHHSDTLRASVNKPCPYYNTNKHLVYANEVGDRLSFSRNPSRIHELSERKIERTIKKKSKEIQKLAENATKKGGSFTALGNNEFDALFYATDRDNESQFRLLFTPLAQKELIKVIKDNSVGYGDDFYFIKRKMINYIYPNHLKDVKLNVQDNYFTGINYDEVEKRFIQYHNSYFKHVYFSFAPLFAIPLYTQHQTQECIYKDLYHSCVSFYQHEMAANSIDINEFKPQDSVTENIIKTSLIESTDNVDTISINTWGYKTVSRTDYVSVRGGDNNWHDVPVHWTEYIKVNRQSKMEVKVQSNVNVEVDQSNDYKYRVGLMMARILK